MSGKIYKGCCPCDGITFFFKTGIPLHKWPIRVCDCSFCSERIGHLYCADSKGGVRFEFVDLKKVKQYRHGTNTAAFIECTECSSFMAAVMKNRGSQLAVLNVQYLLEKIIIPDPYKLVWGGENIGTRLARRSRTWTPVLGDMVNLEE